MARRGENIYKRKDKRWEGRYIKGRKPDGKIIYGYVYGASFADVRIKLAGFKHKYRVYSGEFTGFTGTVYDWAVYCMEDIMKAGIKESTWAYYNGMLQNHILPCLGKKKLNCLMKNDIQVFVDGLSQKGLTPASVRGVFGLLNRLLKEAVSKSAMIVNPCMDISLPKKTRPKIEVLSSHEQKMLESAALKDEHGIEIILALYTGMRIGEICALRWENVDLKNGIIHVKQTVQRLSCQDGERKTKIVFDTPKSPSSDRLIPIPAKIRTLLSDLKAASKNEFVVTSENGFAEPRLVRLRYQKLMQKTGIKYINFHALRHTFATRCMELRFDVTTLSRILGHSSVKMTLDIYTDSLLEHKIISMRMLDKLFSIPKVTAV